MRYQHLVAERVDRDHYRSSDTHRTCGLEAITHFSIIFSLVSTQTARLVDDTQ